MAFRLVGTKALPKGTNCNEILIEIHTFSIKKMHLKRSSAKWWPFCLSLNVLSAKYVILLITCVTDNYLEKDQFMWKFTYLGPIWDIININGLSHGQIQPSELLSRPPQNPCLYPNSDLWCVLFTKSFSPRIKLYKVLHEFISISISPFELY